jgi:hypothetical protein
MDNGTGSGAKRIRQANHYKYHLLYGQFLFGIKKLITNFHDIKPEMFGISLIFLVIF